MSQLLIEESLASANSITLIVDTPEGTMIRRIPPAIPLKTKSGPAAEAATHSAAAVWGMPDYVFTSPIQRVGPGVREKGDGYVVVGDLGLMLQVKHRDLPSQDSAKEERWLRKKTRSAISQANGSIRLLSTPDQVIAINARGREVTLDLREVRWVTVVIIDHDEIPRDLRLEEELSTSKVPAVVLTRREWEFLFQQLKSTMAVASYLVRVAPEDGAVALGEEFRRYYELAAADLEATPGHLAAEYESLGGRKISHPALPQAPAGLGTPDSLRGFHSFRLLLEDIATSEWEMEPGVSEMERLRMLAAIDSVPLQYRDPFGRQLLDWLTEVSTVDGGIKFLSRRIVAGRGYPHLGFMAMSRLGDDTIALFEAWAVLRHYDVAQAEGLSDRLRTVAVMLTPRRDSMRLWDTTTISLRGDLGIGQDELDRNRALFRQGNLNARTNVRM